MNLASERRRRKRPGDRRRDGDSDSRSDGRGVGPATLTRTANFKLKSLPQPIKLSGAGRGRPGLRQDRLRPAPGRLNVGSPLTLAPPGRGLVNTTPRGTVTTHRITGTESLYCPTGFALLRVIGGGLPPRRCACTVSCALVCASALAVAAAATSAHGVTVEDPGILAFGGGGSGNGGGP